MVLSEMFFVGTRDFAGQIPEAELVPTRDAACDGRYANDVGLSRIVRARGSVEREPPAHRASAGIVEPRKRRWYTGTMTTKWSCLQHLSDRELLDEVATLAAREREATADLIASLIEVDARRLYLGESCSSLFTFCTAVLHLSEHAAYNRIEAARAGRRFPTVLGQLADGSVTLTEVRLLAPHLTDDNHRALLESARHKSKRDIEHIVAALRHSHRSRQPSASCPSRQRPLRRCRTHPRRLPSPRRSFTIRRRGRP